MIYLCMFHTEGRVAGVIMDQLGAISAFRAENMFVCVIHYHYPEHHFLDISNDLVRFVCSPLCIRQLYRSAVL